jgi:hypothetical protein
MRNDANENRSHEERAYTWKGQLAIGKAGEEVVKDWLESRGLTIIDCRSVRAFQEDDVDFVVLHGPEEGEHFRAEVKTDTYDNDFVFFETHTTEHNPGALFKSRARVWYIYKSKQGRIVEMEPARVITYLWLHANDKNYRLYPVFNEKKVCRAWGVRVRIDDLQKLGGVVHFLLEGEQNDTTDSQDTSTTEGGG